MKSSVCVPKYDSYQKSIAGSTTSNQRTTYAPPRIGPASTSKFSSDIERLQRIYNTRNSPAGAQFKLVIDLLFESRQALTAEQINEACYVDIKGNKAVFQSLANNPKVSYDGNCYSYKSTHNVRDQKELLQLIRTFSNGIAVVDLKDAYPTVMHDLQALEAGRQIWLLDSSKKEKIAYPNDPRVPSIRVDDELKQLFRSIELPKEMVDIVRDLHKNGMKPATDIAKRKEMAGYGIIKSKPKQKKKRKTEISARTKVTNSHLPELFLPKSGDC